MGDWDPVQDAGSFPDEVGVGREGLGVAEVGDLDDVLVGEVEHVVGLEVAVQDPLLGQVHHALSDLPDHLLSSLGARREV